MTFRLQHALGYLFLHVSSAAASMPIEQQQAEPAGPSPGTPTSHGGFLGQGGGAGGVYRALHQLLPLVQPLRAKYHTPDIKSCGTVSDHLANMVESLSVALLVMGLAWMITATRAAKRHKQQIQQAAVEHDNLLQQLSASHKEHTSNVEEARRSLKKARAETRMLTRHHTDKFHLPDPVSYHNRFSVLLYAAKNYGFLEGENMVANLLESMYKLVKLQVLYDYVLEVLQMVSTPSIEAEDDLILQRDDGPSPSRATEEAMWGKITRLDDDLDAAIQKYLDTIAEPSILNSLEPKWNNAANERFKKLIQDGY